MIKIYQCDGNKNVGDTLTKPLIENILNTRTQNVSANYSSKLLGVGSIISWALKENDIVWGSGLIKNEKYNVPKCKILALRGKLTAKNLSSSCDTLSDPAILLPLIYNPKIEKKYKIGIIEHYIDQGRYSGSGYKINVIQNWKNFIEEVKSCENILSSSLHGLIIAEAYGIPCQRLVISNNIIGGDYKFIDYLSASNRKNFGYFENIKIYQELLIDSLKKYYESE
jgi:pyruvyltransferase